ncbi:hypothetical protein ACH34W_38600 [Actinomadura sp. 6N118]
MALTFIAAFAFICGVVGTINLRWPVLVGWPMFGLTLTYAVFRWREWMRQYVWLDGSLLSLTRGRKEVRCDLSSVRVAKVEANLASRGEPSLPVLKVQDAESGDTLRYVLRTDAHQPLSAGDIHALADAFETAPQPSPAALATASRLREIAQHGLEPSPTLTPVDWSHRVSRRSQDP